jgi:hypothetical protein
MANMSYCRFENTYHDLLDCLQNISEETNDRDERFRKHMIETLVEMVENCESEEDLMDFIMNNF